MGKVQLINKKDLKKEPKFNTTEDDLSGVKACPLKEDDTEPVQKINKAYFTNPEGEEIETITKETEVYLVIEMENMSGEDITIELPDHKGDFQYEGQKITRDKILKVSVSSDTERIKLEVVEREDDDGDFELPAGIEEDEAGVHGYMPTKDSAYYKYRDKFTDPEWVGEQREIRAEYLKESKKLEATIESMTEEGKSQEEIARYVVEQRNQQKVEARKKMSPEDVKGLEERNIKKYGNPVGPTADQLLEKQGSWDKVIEGSMRKDPVINKLLGL